MARTPAFFYTIQSEKNFRKGVDALPCGCNNVLNINERQGELDMRTFKQRAKACFDIIGTDQQLTLGPAVFDWNPAEGDSDQHAAKYLKQYLFKHDLSNGRPVMLRWVTCGPVRD